MKSLELPPVAHPETLRELPGLVDLFKPNVASGQVDLDDGFVSIHTSETPWSYAASFELNPDCLPQEDILLAVTAEALSGKAGVLLADGQRVLREVFFEPEDDRRTKLLHASDVTPATKLIVRTADRRSGAHNTYRQRISLAGFRWRAQLGS